MSRKILMLAALAVFGLACEDATTPGSRPGSVGSLTPGASPGIPTERLARFVARALSDPEVRSYLRAELERSPYVEHKLHLQRLLNRGDGRMRAAIARANGIADAEVTREAAAATALEIYLPVPEHRQAWSGDANVLVATAMHDREAPVAFDPRGRRVVLSPDQPPETPVIALVPVETDFDAQPQRVECLTCEGGGGGGLDAAVSPPPPGLYMTKAHFVKDFESWFKGRPELEAHILGQKGATDSLTSYQCAGQRAVAPYYFNQDGADWSGSVLLFSAAQIASYNAAHPNQNFRVFFLEDDDTPCTINTDRNLLRDLFIALDAKYDRLTAGNDSTGWFRHARALQKLYEAVASLILTNDDVVGNAVEDAVVGSTHQGFNWLVKGRDDVTNGWVNLVMQ